MQRRILGLTLALSLALGLPGVPAVAAPAQPLSLTASVRALQAYGIVDRLPESELRLDETISRAEMAKVLGAALKLQKAADEAKQASPFPDTTGHWAAGWIAAARDRGIFQGRDDGLFHPQDQVTYAEVLTVLLRLTGRGPQAAVSWPWGAIATAAEVGMVPADMELGGRMYEAATRGSVFRLTAIAVGRTTLAGSGDTLLQSLGDRTPPTLDLVRVPAVTSDWRPILAARAEDAVTVRVGGADVDLQADGSFSVEVQLQKGENTVTFLAMDGAGNRSERTATVLFQPIAKLEFAPALIETSVGQTFKPEILRYDAQGHPAPAESVIWSYDTGALTRDAATGTFKATRPGDYTLRASVEGTEATARVSVAGAPARVELKAANATVVAGGAPIQVTVQVLDADGRLVTAGSSQVQLSSLPAQGATFDTPTVTTVRGRATAYLMPGQAIGGLGIQAAISGTVKLTSPVVPLNVEQRRVSGIQIATVPPNVQPLAGQTVIVTATAVDQVGIPMAVREDTTVTLSASNDSVLRLTRGAAVIKAGNSSSDSTGSNGMAVTTGNSGTVNLIGYRSGLIMTPGPFASVVVGSRAALDVQVIREAAPADKLSAALVTVTRRDELGNVVPTDSTPVVLFSQKAGISVSQVSDSGGVALFAVRSGTAGRVELAAGLPGRPELNTRPVTVAFVQAAGSARPALRTSARTGVAGSAVTAWVALESSAGQVMANPGPPLTFTLEAPGATLTTAQVVIPTGATRSGDAIVNLPLTGTSVSLSGRMVGGDSLTAAAISVTQPVVTPEPVVNGSNLIAVPALAGRPPVAGEDVRFTVRSRNGLQLNSGAHAFGLQVLLNGREVTGALPGLTIKAGPRTLDRDDILRTTGGEAELWVRYTGTGTIQLKPVPGAADNYAYDQWGVAGIGQSTDTFQAIAGKVTFAPGALERMEVLVTPNLGDTSQGVIRATRGRYATIRLSPVDQYGNPAGDSSCLATLTSVRQSRAGALVLRSASADVTEQSLPVGQAGYAQFTVAATTDLEATSEWSPFMVCGDQRLTAAQNITVQATVHAAPTPAIEFAGGDVSGAGRIDPDDAYLDLRIRQLADAPDTAELLVYDGANLIGRFGPVSARSSTTASRTVKLPLELFEGFSRTMALRVRIHSGADVSDESDPIYVTYSNTR